MIYVSLKPSPSRWKSADNFRKTNELIKAEISKDQLHLNEKGDVIWREVLAKYLK